MPAAQLANGSTAASQQAGPLKQEHEQPSAAAHVPLPHKPAPQLIQPQVAPAQQTGMPQQQQQQQHCAQPPPAPQVPTCISTINRRGDHALIDTRSLLLLRHEWWHTTDCGVPAVCMWRMCEDAPAVQGLIMQQLHQQPQPFPQAPAGLPAQQMGAPTFRP